MSALTISCGDFQAGDKAGSAFERVLGELHGFPAETRRHILSGFDAGEHTSIDPADAGELIALLRTYRDRLIAEIGHGDWLREMEREERTGICSVKLRWGEGRGARLCCAINLLAACERSVAVRQPVLVCLA